MSPRRRGGAPAPVRRLPLPRRWRSKTRSARSSSPESRILRGLPLPHPARHRFRGAGALLRRPTTSTSSSGRNYLVTVHDGRLAHRSSRSPRSARATRSAARRRARPRCCTASSTRWSTTTGRRSTSSRSGWTSSRSSVFDSTATIWRGRSSTSSATSPSLRRVRPAAARRRRPAGAARVPADQRTRWPTGSATSTTTSCASPTRRCSSRIAITGLLDANLSIVSNQLNQVMKILTVIVDDLHAADRSHRPVRHERGAAAFRRRRAPRMFWWLIGIMIAQRRDHAGVLPPATAGSDAWPESTGCRPTSPTRSPPAKSSSGRPRSSRSWSRTRSTPARAASRSRSSSAARS